MIQDLSKQCPTETEKKSSNRLLDAVQNTKHGLPPKNLLNTPSNNLIFIHFLDYFSIRKTKEYHKLKTEFTKKKTLSEKRKGELVEACISGNTKVLRKFLKKYKIHV